MRETVSPTPGSMLQTLKERRERLHPNCVVCSPSNAHGLHLRFTACEDGSIEARFHCEQVFEGFENYLHGGIVSSLLDGAMTNCLFAHGHVATTGELNVRFRRPVLAGKVATVRAWIERSSPRLYVLKGELLQEDVVKATAFGKFVAPHRSRVPGEDLS